ncbi:MAG: hypothetical protein LPJ89_00685 [Hymenobacteraceae bacterium]|nr:hypothetical protein [Hymenobacteraceae bacterium]MDX5394954.1 hypothetical protein [Hymenobacteraceae bacterium]MDX5442281.1 hypothetical protein [Hymenobacteraceae bacterium]MDX5510988.1 hypothetical protein [Hymenobacteraceae bacterium]
MATYKTYFRIGLIGIVLTFIVQTILVFAVDPYFAGILTPFYPVWIIILVVGWRKRNPRR